ncbi:hypothetical protein HanXRQr2_Chr05g0234561 [Helianthus annuus]|uniref:Uncharacterized protein n=1 Tax=Helianthus annuus TaxID=4232 RepID=A0A9K3NP55_HELAN|nr:hypothetical protein HanXRQr2_Chr05g0234561 [Helianthus annuus]KAJ0453745.1 hypothetical protein HanIR_Chr15g0732581 [Helianthus annuus]
MAGMELGYACTVTELVYAYAVRMSAGYYNGNGRVGFIDGAVDVVALIQFG